LNFDTSGVKPLTDMEPSDSYHGFSGGLYPRATKERPKAHEQAGLELARSIQPLGADGNSNPKGKIVLLTIGFSNTAQCSQGFSLVGRQDKDLNPSLVIVNGAQGGRSAFMIQDPEGNPVAAAYWDQHVPERLRLQNVTAAQVQAIWLK